MRILANKMIIQIFLDMIKAIPLFFIIAIFVSLKIKDWSLFLITLFSVILAVISLYGIGILISGFTLIFRKTSNISNLISYSLIFLQEC